MYGVRSWAQSQAKDKARFGTLILNYCYPLHLNHWCYHWCLCFPCFFNTEKDRLLELLAFVFAFFSFWGMLYSNIGFFRSVFWQWLRSPGPVLFKKECLSLRRSPGQLSCLKWITCSSGVTNESFFGSLRGVDSTRWMPSSFVLSQVHNFSPRRWDIFFGWFIFYSLLPLAFSSGLFFITRYSSFCLCLP